MVIDSSALVAILLREPEEAAFRTAILASTIRLIGTPSYLETAMVLIGRFGPASRSALDRLIAALHAEIVAFSPAQARIAVDAFLRFGKGRQHPAGLNFGDCCSYALAQEMNVPLLFKGTDFAATDIQPALVP